MDCESSDPTICQKKRVQHNDDDDKKRGTIQHNQFYVPTHAKSKPIVFHGKKCGERKEEVFALAIIKMCIVNAVIEMQNRTLPKNSIGQRLVLIFAMRHATFLNSNQIRTILKSFFFRAFIKNQNINSIEIY